MFVMLTNFHQVFVGKEFIIFGSLIGSLFLVVSWVEYLRFA